MHETDFGDKVRNTVAWSSTRSSFFFKTATTRRRSRAARAYKGQSCRI